jgi:hypothetical protein
MEVVTQDLEIIRQSSNPDNIVRYDISYRARKEARKIFCVVFVTLHEYDMPLLLLKLN